MTNVIKNLEQSKSVCEIIDDLNELILTLRGRNHDMEPEPVKAVTVTPVQIMTETKPKAEPVQKQTKTEPVQKQTKAEKNTVTVMKPAAQPVAAQPAAVVPPAKPVKKLAKSEQVKTTTKTPAPGREKVECRCGLMVCNAAMSRHEKGAKHKEAMTKKEKTEMKQAEGQSLGVSDMDLVDIETYMKVMLPRLYKKVRGLGGQVHNDETFGYVKIEGDRDKMIDTMYNIIMPDVNRKLANALPRKFDELMNSSKKYNRYVNISNKSYEAYKTKNKYVYFIIISKSNEVYLTTYEQKQLEENVHVYDDEIINELYEIEKDIFDEEIEKINKEIFG
jgi:hypothetical protein